MRTSPCLFDPSTAYRGGNGQGGPPRDSLDPLAAESLALLCCPEPYAPCRLEERTPRCDDIVAPILRHAAASSEDLLERLQRARGELVWADAACSAALAPELPRVACDGNAMVFHRPDLFCELLLWQSEQLGRVSEGEFRALTHVEACPPPADAPRRKPRRAGGRLDLAQLPRWAQELLPGAAHAEL